MKALLLLLLSASAVGQTKISIRRSDQALLPGSVRPLYATVDGSSNLSVHWKATGGCSLANAVTTASPQQVTAPAQGATCTLTKAPFSIDTRSFESPISCTVTATSEADPTRSASIVLPICAQQVMLTTFPAFTVLYKQQLAVIQSDLRGSVNTGVTWAITSNPGGSGTLTGGTANRHAVFSATSPGTYILTATSRADPHKKASTTIYVTPHNLPPPNRDHTEQIDCSSVSIGRTYDVGPSRSLRNLASVPWQRLQPGDTVRIHNDDATGKSPTTYHEKISISATGTPQKPIRVCGVPDAQGNKPIIDGDNATSFAGADWENGHLEGSAAILIYKSINMGSPALSSNRNIAVEGLHIRNVTPDNKFIRLKDGAPTPYGFAGCVHVHSGRDVLIRGNEFENCSQAVFTNSLTPQGTIVYDLTVEGNYIHHWGSPNSIYLHGMYLQGIGVTLQFNYFGASDTDHGNVVKDRSVLNFLRWNYLAQGGVSGRTFDMVEPQDFECYIIPNRFAYLHSSHNDVCNRPRAGAPADPFTPDQVAANFEAYHSDYIYGNIMDDSSGASAFVHYAFDQGTIEAAAFNRRPGALYYWNNTHLVRKPKTFKLIFEASAPDNLPSYEYPWMQSSNNVFEAEPASNFQWTKAFWTRMVVDSNWIKPDPYLPYRHTLDTYQGGSTPKELATCDKEGSCRRDNGHMEWRRGGKPGTQKETLYLGTGGFNPYNFLPSPKLRGLGAPLPPAIADQPSNMQYFPATNTISIRKDLTVLGALD